MFTEDPEELKNKQTGMNNAPERINRISEPEKQLNEVAIGNLPEKEFSIMIVKMIQDLRKTVELIQEVFT